MTRYVVVRLFASGITIADAMAGIRHTRGSTDAPKAHVRFFNDSARPANFHLDGQFVSSVPANPGENLAIGDAKSVPGSTS